MEKIRKLIGLARYLKFVHVLEKKGTKSSNRIYDMLLVIYPVLDLNRRVGLLSLIDELMKSIELLDYTIVEEKSSIYGKTMDILYKGMEIGLAVIGPVSIDSNWKIAEPWIRVVLA